MQSPTSVSKSKASAGHLIVLLLTFIVFVASSCQKGDAPEPDLGAGRLIKVVDRGRDSVSVTYFEYDKDNGHRLKSIAIEHHGMLFFRKHFYYDASGKLVKVLLDNLLNPNAPDQIDTLVYTGDLLTSMLTSTNSSIKFVYHYDGGGRLTSDSFYFSSPLKADGYTQFLYDVNDNLIEWEHFSWYEGRYNSSGRYRTTFNEHLNPYYSFKHFDIPTLGLGRNLPVSKYLAATLTHPGGSVVKFDYSLYSNGLPRLLVRSSSNWSGISEFYYE